MDLNEQNVPDAYKAFMANNPNNQMLGLEDGYRDYTIYSYHHLISHNPYDKKGSPPYFQWLSDAELDYKPLEGDIADINIALLRKAFVFGSVDSGTLFFHPMTHQIYIIYLDLYVQKVADSFDDFLENTTIFDKWEI